MPDAPLILIVEDEADVRLVLCTFFEQCGYRIASANERSVGAEILKATRPDMIVADMTLRGGNGQDLAKLAKSLGVPVILITGDPTNIERMTDQSIPFLQKPFHLIDLEREVSRILSEKRPEGA